MWMNVHDYSDIITANCCTGTVQDWTKLHRPRGGSSHNCHLSIKPSTSVLSSWRSCHGNCHQVQILQRSYLIPDIPNTTKNITCKAPHTPTQHPDPMSWHLTSDLIFCWQTMRKYFKLVSKSIWDPSWVVTREVVISVKSCKYQSTAKMHDDNWKSLWHTFDAVTTSQRKMTKWTNFKLPVTFSDVPLFPFRHNLVSIRIFVKIIIMMIIVCSVQTSTWSK